MSTTVVSPHITSSFSSAVRSRGDSYYWSGRVTLLEGDDFHCAATVTGSRSFQISLVIDDEKPEAIGCYCGCPVAFENGELCKHIWATLRAAQDRGWLRGKPGHPLQYVFVDDGGGEFSPPSPGRRSGNAHNGSAAPPPRRRPPVKAAWEAQVESIRGPVTLPERGRPAVWDDRRQLFYVLNPEFMRFGDIVVDMVYRDKKKNGDWTKPTRGGPKRNEIPRLPDPVDRDIALALLGAEQANAVGYTQYSFQLSDVHTELILPRILQTGRCLWKLPYPSKDYLPLQWDDGPAWRFTIDVSKADNKSFQLTGMLERGEERVPAQKARFVAKCGFVLLGDRFARLDHGNAACWLDFFRRQPKLDVPANDFDRFLSAAYDRPEPPPLALPEEVAVRVQVDPPQPVLYVRPYRYSHGSRTELEAEAKFVYGDLEFSDDDHGIHKFDSQTRTLCRRDRPAELAYLERLALTKMRRAGMYSYADRSHFVLLNNDLVGLVRTLTAEGWRVEAEGKLFRSAGKFELNVASGIDWFELHGNVDFAGQSVALPKILAALRKQQTTIDLDDGSVGMMPTEWLKKYGLLASVGDAESEHVRFRRNQIGLLDALLAAQPDVNYDAKFRKAREEFQSFAGIDAAEPPETFRGQLRPYQCDGLGWLLFLRRFGFGGCLADDMGLGKTVQVLAMLAERAVARKKGDPRTSLIVVPKSLVFNWKAEAARFAPKLAVLDHTGPDRVKLIGGFQDYDVALTTYGTLRNDAAMLQNVEFDYCILDESQAVKNARTESAKAVRLLCCRHRLAMSGTPIENHLGELWSLFDFLNPGMLGKTGAFAAISSAGRNPDPEARNILAQALRPFILRRTKDQVARDLPQKTEQTVFCDLDEKQRKTYDDLREYYRRSLMMQIDAVGLAKSKIQVLEALLRLRQAACHPALLDKKRADEPSAKLDVLLPKLQEVFEEGHKVLVFSQFTSFLSLVKKRLDEMAVPYEYLDGKTRDRQACVERFQNDPKCQLFLISLKAGGVGLNLTAAEYVFLLDPWWNPAVEAQAIDRTHRIGQTRPVFAYRIIARDTVEEKVLALQDTKRALADAIINADNALIRTLKKEDLELLLS